MAAAAFPLPALAAALGDAPSLHPQPPLIQRDSQTNSPDQTRSGLTSHTPLLPASFSTLLPFCFRRYCYHPFSLPPRRRVTRFLHFGWCPHSLLPYPRLNHDPKKAAYPIDQPLRRAHLTVPTTGSLVIYETSHCLKPPTFTHRPSAARNLSLVCLYALLRFSPFTITAETQHHGSATWRRSFRWAYHRGSICIGNNLNRNCERRNTQTRNPDVADSRTVRVVDSACRVNSLRHRQSVSQLCLVGNCVHAMLHNRHNYRGRVGLG